MRAGMATMLFNLESLTPEPLMDLLAPVKAVGWVTGVFGAEKSFAANPIIGSPRLNRLGLHRRRVATAAAMAARRRRAMAEGVPAEDREAFDRDGFVIKRDYLPADIFARLRREAFSEPLPAREMRQGRTVTRMIPLGPDIAARLPTARAVIANPVLRRLTGYVAGRAGEPHAFIQTVIAEPAAGPGAGGRDPQTAMHADTFHSTAKYWLFLHDVGEEDGPFIYLPGSHRLTPERLEWEYEQSLTARDAGRHHHSLGSFRATPAQAKALGYGAPKRMAVRGNTLVVADTYGFHSRAPSDRPTVRTEIHGNLRRNPFAPWNGLDIQAAPGVRGRQVDLYLAYADWRSRRSGKPPLWRDVGAVKADGPASI